MKKDITLRLRGLSGDETIASEYRGRLFEKDGKYVVFYDEVIASDEPPVKSTLRFDPSELSITREGMGGPMHFIVGQKTSCIYTTFAGDMTLDIETTRLVISEGETAKVICDYSLSINGGEAEEKHISIEIE